MKRILQGFLGMVLLGGAGLILLHQTVDAPAPSRAQAGSGPAGLAGGMAPNGGGQPAAGSGQYKEIVPALLGALADPDGKVRQLAAATLVKIGPDAVPPLVEALKAKDRETRANAAYVLGHLSGAAHEALPPLAGALKDQDQEVRRRAAYAIYNIVNHSEMATAAAGFGGASPDGSGEGGGLPGPLPAVQRMLSGGPTAPGMVGPWDPGLLVPPAEGVPGKPVKGKE
jgi:hypothetical protein